MALGASFYLLDTLEAPFYALETLQVCFKCAKKVKRSPKESRAQLCLPGATTPLHSWPAFRSSPRGHLRMQIGSEFQTRQPLIKYDYVIQLR